MGHQAGGRRFESAGLAAYAAVRPFSVQGVGWCRRYAVPRRMIAECAEARDRGDWRAACAAARVTVEVGEPRSPTGSPVGPAARAPDGCGDLLAGLAPDLLRWHLPRALGGAATVAPGMRYLLAPDGPVTADTAVLEVRTPGWVTGSQRLNLHALRMGDLAEGPVFPLPPYMWDVRRAHELNDVARANADADPWAAAGWVVDHAATDEASRWETDSLREVDPLFAARELRRVAAQFGRDSWQVWTVPYRYRWWRPHHRWWVELAGEQLRITRRPAGSSGAELCLLPALLHPPIDVALIEHGRIGVDDLHPLVRAALHPSAKPADDERIPAEKPDGDQIVRVRCGANWHRLSVRLGPARTPRPCRRGTATGTHPAGPRRKGQRLLPDRKPLARRRRRPPARPASRVGLSPTAATSGDAWSTAAPAPCSPSSTPAWTRAWRSSIRTPGPSPARPGTHGDQSIVDRRQAQ